MAAIALTCEVIIEGNTREGEKRIIAWVNGHLWTFQRQPPEGYIIGSREFLFLLTNTRRLYRASVKLSLNTLEGLIVIIDDHLRSTIYPEVLNHGKGCFMLPRKKQRGLAYRSYTCHANTIKLET